MKRYVWLGGLVLAGTLAMLARLHGAGAAPQATAAPRAPNVPTITVATGTFVAKISAEGRVGPPSGGSAKLAFPIAGILARVDVRVGDRVGAGQPLAELDRAPLGIALAQARADALAANGQYDGGAVPSAALAGAQAKLDLSRERLRLLESRGEAALSSRIAAQAALRQASLKVDADRAALARAQTLFGGGVVAQKDLDAAQAQLASDLADRGAAQARVAASGADYDASLAQARADVASAENDVAAARAQRPMLGGQSQAASARVAAAELAYRSGVLSAPSAGIVLAILRHPGEAIDPTTPAIELAAAPSGVATFGVPASEAARIAAGDQAELDIRGRTTRGSVRAVVPAVDPATQLATVVVDGVPAGAVQGDGVRATITVARERGIIVPSTAIVQDPQSGKTLAFVTSDGATFSPRDVTVRASDADTSLVGTGLRPGERIAARGAFELLAQ